MKNLYRQEYKQGILDFDDLLSNPILQFDKWYHEMLKSGITEPNAMALSTTGKNCRPSSRIVLLKDYSQKGFTFFQYLIKNNKWKINRLTH